jgi:phospholipase C
VGVLTTAAAMLGALTLLPGPAAEAARLSAPAVAGPCGTLPYDQNDPPDYSHIVMIMDENLSYDQLQQSTIAPYLHGLAARCGSETNMHAATHPSQPNYMAATSGIASGVGVHTANDNIFAQLQSSGRAWRTYAESMPKPCSPAAASSPTYKIGHNPAFFYTDLRTPENTCLLNDLPMSPGLGDAIASDSLTAYTWIVPNLCDDIHWIAACSYPRAQRVGAGDDWLSTVVPRLTATPSYQAGRTLIVITFDEGTGGSTNGVDCTDPAYYPAHADCRIATIVVSPYIVPGAVDGTDQNLYSLLATTEDILRLPRLNRAVGQPSLRPGLRF